MRIWNVAILMISSYLWIRSMVIGKDIPPVKRLVCYWNASSISREGLGKYNLNDLSEGLSNCTHLIYAFADIDLRTQRIRSLNPTINNNGTEIELYNYVIGLKKIHPTIKIYLSIRGNIDYYYPDAYLTVISSRCATTKFIQFVQQLIKMYEFDGIDLASICAPEPSGVFNVILRRINRFFGRSRQIDRQIAFTNLVRRLKKVLKNKDLTLTILPPGIPSAYHDQKVLGEIVNTIHVMAFDQFTPRKNPKAPDHPAPLYAGSQGKDVHTIIRDWTTHVDKSKIVLGIPTYGHAWKISMRTEIMMGVPESARGPAFPKTVTGIPGLLSRDELCMIFASRYGWVQKRLPKKESSFAYEDILIDANGAWVGYEDTKSVVGKVKYAMMKELGGVAVHDLSLDSHQALCLGQKYQILKVAKSTIEFLKEQ